MSRTLYLPEILDAVLYFLDDSDLASCARVSQLWNDISVKYLWKEIPEPGVLLNLLGPLDLKRPNIVASTITYDYVFRPTLALTIG